MGGFSLVELMVAMSVMLAISGAALSLSLSSRRLYEADEARTRLNQSLRAGIDLVGTDVRQAGERLPDDFPALEIVDTPGGEPDVVIVRRNLVDTVLPLCRDAAAADDRLYVAEPGVGAPVGCLPPDDENGDGWADNLEAWRTWRIEHGGRVRGYIYSPVARSGEFFSYVGEHAGLSYVARDDDEDFAQGYAIADQCRLYLLEERRYELSHQGLLQVVLDGDRSAPMHVVDGIVDFQALARFSDGTQRPALGPADLWSDLRSIEVALRGRTELRGALIERRLATDFFPRNVLSR